MLILKPGIDKTSCFFCGKVCTRQTVLAGDVRRYSSSGVTDVRTSAGVFAQRADSAITTVKDDHGGPQGTRY
jgi:hypothetical protein